MRVSPDHLFGVGHRLIPSGKLVTADSLGDPAVTIGIEPVLFQDPEADTPFAGTQPLVDAGASRAVLAEEGDELAGVDEKNGAHAPTTSGDGNVQPLNRCLCFHV